MNPSLLKSAVQALEGLGDDVIRGVLQDNAARLYRVELPPATA